MINLFDHNVAVYEKFLDNRKTSNNNLIVQATGTGKSNIIARFIDEFYRDKRVLYVAPTITIYDKISSYTEWNFDHIEFSTYHSLHKCKPQDFDLCILDEAHRAAAPTWRIKSDRFLKSKTCEVLGTTATEMRMDGIDISKKLFDEEHSVFSFNWYDAIEEGILPKMEYVAAMLEPETIIGECYCKIKENKRLNTLDNLKQLKIAKENIIPMKDIIANHSKKYDAKKFLVFCDKIESSEVWADKMKEIIPNVKTIIVNSKMKANECRKSIEEFEDCNTTVALISVNKLNEGVHLNGVDAIIMIRSTKSHVIYLQQMGRVLKYDKETIKSKRALVFDFVANNIRMDLGNIGVIKNFHKICKSRNKSEDRINSQDAIITYIYDEDIRNIAERLGYNTYRITWTDEMVNDAYDMNLNDKYISKKYNISRQVIKRFRDLHNISRKFDNRITWTDEMISDLYNEKLTNKHISRKYNIGRDSVRIKRKELAITKDRVDIKLTNEMISDLCNEDIGDTYISKKYNIPRGRIRTLRNKYNIPNINNRITWTDEMISDLYNKKLSITKISNKYHISHNSIVRKCNELSIKNSHLVTWTDEMITDLELLGNNDLSNKYEISLSAISSARRKYKIKAPDYFHNKIGDEINDRK